jgi:triosephosphate isomerase
MILNAGGRWVLIGHSERRSLFGETDADVQMKTKSALDQGLKPVVCVGETLEERESDLTESVLRKQVADGLGGLSPGAGIVVAYEPVWAIGTGKTATPEQANAAHAVIRRALGPILGEGAAAVVRILYGGSVKPDNAAGLMAQTEIDGALVGGACLNPDSFLRIIRAAGDLGASD